MVRLLLLAALLIACKKEDPGPPCGQIVDHMLEITKQQLVGHDTMQLGDRQQMIDQCEQRKLPRQARTCMMAAKSLTDLAGCQAQGKPTPTPATGGASAPTPAPVAPPPTGSAATSGSGTGG